MRSILAILFAIFILNQVFCQEKRSNLPMEERLQMVLNTKAGMNKMKGVSASVNFCNGENWTGAFGFSHDNVPIEPGTLLGIGSITKVYTATIVMQLIEENKLKLTDSICKYLKSYYNIDSTITVRQLLNHTSGVYNYTFNNSIWNEVLKDTSKLWTPEDHLKFVLAPSFKPGAKWEYSNTNYSLLAMIIEKITGEKYVDVLHKRIIDPLSLKETYFHPFNNVTSRMAHVWEVTNGQAVDKTTIVTSSASFSGAYAAGAIVATARDLALFLNALNGGKLIKPESLELMHTACEKNPEYGLGTTISKQIRNGEKINVFGHNGFIGYASSGFYYPQDYLSITVLCNQNTDPFFLLQHLYTAAINVAPDDIQLSSNIVNEGFKTDELVGLLNTTDENKHASYTYSLERGNGENDADNSCFAIQGSQLIAKCTFNFEIKSNYKILIKSNDGYGGEVYKSFEIKVESPNYLKTGACPNKFKVYPNPSKGTVYIENDKNKNIKFQICDLSGKQLSQIEQYSNGKINLQHLPKGLYLVKVFSAEQVFIQKLVLE